MTRFSRTELEESFGRYQQAARDACATGDWRTWANQFTDDAVYVEHAFGTFQGRTAIADWISKTMSEFPGNAMCDFPIGWHVVDEDRGWIVCQVWNRMADPGDSSIHEAANITILHYAGDSLWSYEEDVYNPADFATMLEGWARRRTELRHAQSAGSS